MIALVTIFLSAFLLFQVQLIMGKMILPWFGGTPSVWTACMLFFQSMLLAGYAYSHWLSQRRSFLLQRRVHLAVLAMSILILTAFALQWGRPILPDNAWKPDGSLPPQWDILLILGAAIGLPFFILSTSSPIIQFWQSRSKSETRVYRLYSVSNAGSLIGLVSYPFVFEPLLTLTQQAYLWTTGFLLFAAGLIALLQKTVEPSANPEPKLESQEIKAERLSLWKVIAWLLLATCTSSLLLSVTNELCQEVAAVPFLWMLPLAIYLLTFIICFDHSRWYQRRPILFFAITFTFAALITSFLNVNLGIIVHIFTLSGFLFFICLTCHGELFSLRPSRSHLTLFYLVIAIGGALGGVFVSIVAPMLLNSFWEFNITITVVWAILGIIFLKDKASSFYKGDWLQTWLILWLVLLVGLRHLWVTYASDVGNVVGHGFAILFCATVAGVLSGCFSWLFRRSKLISWYVWPRFVVIIIIFFAESYMLLRMKEAENSTILQERNFFGAIRLEIDPPSPIKPIASLRLMHGNINHGFQYLHPEYSKIPVSYYGEGSGVYQAIKNHPRRLAGKPIKIGVLGLGVGTIAAFANEGDTVKFYEINPAVVDYSWRQKPYFSYIKDCLGEVELAVGDARLVMEKELQSSGSEKFDILVMDAFSSDSVPVHLMTEEAFALYKSHMRDAQSIIAVNISNRFLDFSDLVANQAKEIDSLAYRVFLKNYSLKSSPCLWMLLIPNDQPEDFSNLLKDKSPWQAQSDITWSDNFSNLWQLLK